ncbi:MAG: hypothetical protein GTN36_04540 [Candidatus Aenigmarchaeota archaeon]|nr:hypothetical protein [Candidatus Aenigmarchaeota archaeon]
MTQKPVVLYRTAVGENVRWIQYSIKASPFSSVIERRSENIIIRSGFNGHRRSRPNIRGLEHLGKMEQDAFRLPKDEFEKKYPNIELNEAI